jgi:Ca-activated chloride channel family protein
MKTITKRIAWCAAMTALLGFASLQRASAAGLLIADGGFGGVLELKEHDVDVTINNGIAVTRVTQVFHNTEQRQVEALYTFPVPRGASVANFSMWINGKEMVGEVVEKARAREIYESYKQTRRDPGLLEQVDFKTFEMRIFPIGPQADQKVQITYYQELEVDHDWATYVYPLATTTRRAASASTAARLAFNLQAKSAVPIAAFESPSHGKDFVIARHQDTFYQASLETAAASLGRDIVLAYQLSRPKTGFDLIASKEQGDDGYFSLTLTPGEDLAAINDGMDYVFLLDVSGSMAQDGKLLLSKDSLGAFVSELGEKDRFEMMTFNVTPNLAFGQLQTPTPEIRERALQFLGSQQARGGTVLNPAITTAYRYADPDRPLNVIVLSDGLTEQQERRTLLELIKSRPRNARVFCIGVGNDVNRPLLEQLADDSGGLAAFLSREDNLTRQAKAFRRKLTRPAATDLKLDIAGVEVYDVEPKTMPNLYHGAPIRIYGRYKGGGKADVAIRGSVNGIEFKQAGTLSFPKDDSSNPEIDRMWAWRRIDSLLKAADRDGNRAGAVQEIVRLGEGYSIVTEYTSFLVLENDAEYQRWKLTRGNLTRVGRDRKAQEMVRSELDSIRVKAMADLGPQTSKPVMVADAGKSVSPIPNSTAPAPAARLPERQTKRNDSGSGLDFNLPGSSPVGPLSVLLLAIFSSLKRRLRHS